jgi:hypothetical protein
MSQEKVFAEGFNFKRNENAPEWIVGRLSANKIQAIKWLENQEGDWVNMNIAQSKSGNYYIELDTWKPTNQLNQPSLNQNQNDKSAPF